MGKDRQIRDVSSAVAVGAPAWGRLAAVTIALWIALAAVVFLYVNIVGPPDRSIDAWRIDNGYWVQFVLGPVAIVPYLVVLVAAVRAAGSRSLLGQAVIAIGLAGVSWHVGNSLWFYYNTCPSWGALGCGSGIAVPFPSKADYLYLGFYPCIWLGLLQVARIVGVSRAAALKALPYLVAVIVAHVVLVVPVALGDATFGGWVFPQDMPTVERLLALAYLIGDGVTLFLGVAMAGVARRAAGGTLFLPILVGGAGIVAFYAADLIFISQTQSDSYRNAGAADAMYAVASVCLCLSLLLMSRLAQRVGTSAHQEAIAARASALQVVVQTQARLLGDVAWRVAEKAPGVRVRTPREIEAIIDPQRALVNLLAEYRSVTGTLGYRASIAALEVAGYPEPAELHRVGPAPVKRAARRWLLPVWVPLAVIAICGAFAAGLFSEAVRTVDGHEDLPGWYLLHLGGMAVLTVLVPVLISWRSLQRLVAAGLGFAALLPALVFTGGENSELIALTIPLVVWGASSLALRVTVAVVVMDFMVLITALAASPSEQHISGVRTLILLGVGLSLAIMRHTTMVSLGSRARDLQRTSDALSGLVDGMDQSRTGERHQVAGEIHDFSLQYQLAALMHAERIKTADEVSAEAATRVTDLIRSSINSLRSVIGGLEPVAVYNLDLRHALAEAALTAGKAWGVDVEVDVDVPDGLTVRKQLVLYRVIAEAVTNAGKHANAEQILVKVAIDGPLIVGSVSDNGSGFAEPVDVLNQVPTQTGMGLPLLFENVRSLNGWVRIASEPGKGSDLTFYVPLNPDEQSLTESSAASGDVLPARRS